VPVIETIRLTLERLTPDDAPFILRLLNEPSFLQYIGDRGVRTLDDAKLYIEAGPMAMYERAGFGLFRVDLKSTGEPIGICGLLKRDTLDDVDVGFAFLPEHWRRGYAYESARASMIYGRDVHALARIVAITALENPASIALLEKLGFQFERTVRLTPEGDELRLFGMTTDALTTEAAG